MTRRISAKKRLKQPDEFITLTGRALIFISKNSKAFLIIILVIFFMLFSIAGFITYKNHKENKASDLLAKALKLYQETNREGEGNEENTVDENIENKVDVYDSAIKELDDIIKNYKNTISAKYAILYKSNLLYKLKNYEDSIKTINTLLQFQQIDENLKALSLNVTAKSFESMKDYNNAIQQYEKILGISDNPIIGSTYESIIRCYVLSGNIEKAKEFHNKALEKYPEEQWARGLKDKMNLYQ